MNISLDGLTFDDVLLLPGYSEVKRDAIDISTVLTKTIKLAIPLLSSPMDTVTTAPLATSLAQEGGLGIIHRNLSIEEQVKEVKKVKDTPPSNPLATIDAHGKLRVGAAVGIGEDLEKRIESLLAAGVDAIILDSGHGLSKVVIEATRSVKNHFPHLPLIAGNIATGEGAQKLIAAGADALRVGMGPGSICATRIMAGIGMPQMTAIDEVVKIAKKSGIPVIADGGIKHSGDLTKALAMGANTIMIGSLFAATEEAPGEVIKLKEKKYKYYRGMGSIPAMKQGGAARYGQEVKKGRKLIAEGVEGLVPYKGTVEEFVTQMMGGLRAGMYYVGAKNLEELAQKARFVRISNASLIESHPHDIIVTDAGENY